MKSRFLTSLFLSILFVFSSCSKEVDETHNIDTSKLVGTTWYGDTGGSREDAKYTEITLHLYPNNKAKVEGYYVTNTIGSKFPHDFTDDDCYYELLPGPLIVSLYHIKNEKGKDVRYTFGSITAKSGGTFSLSIGYTFLPTMLVEFDVVRK